MFEAIAFYFFLAILIASALMVIAARNPVHSVLFLILAFFNAAGLFVLVGAEFLGMILIVVYVGAVAVLFLFVVMMLDIDFAELKRGTLQYLPFGALIGLILAAELIMAGSVWVLQPAAHAARAHATPPGLTNHRRAGAHPLYRLYLLLPDRRPGAAGGDDRRHRADPAPPPRGAPPGHCRADARTRRHGGGHAGPQAGRGGVMTIGLPHYLAVAAILFTIGMLGIFLNRRNIIIILMSVELILLAVNLNFVAFSAYLGDLVGQVFALFVLTVAAAEAAIGLAILVVYFRNRGTIAVEDVNLMKG